MSARQFVGKWAFTNQQFTSHNFTKKCATKHACILVRLAHSLLTFDPEHNMDPHRMIPEIDKSKRKI